MILSAGNSSVFRSDPLFLLAIETAGSACSVAVLHRGSVVAAERRPMRYGHAEALFPIIDQVMGQAGLPPARLDAVAAATGPGGFTGIRVGLAAAHGIALAAKARLIGVTSFAAVAAAVAVPEDGYGAALLVALDSRRADLYVQLFGADGVCPLVEPAAVMPEALADYVACRAGRAPLLVAGDAAEAAASALRNIIELRIIVDSAPDARGVAAAASRQLGSGAALSGAKPFYLRPPDVTPPKRAAPHFADNG